MTADESKTAPVGVPKVGKVWLYLAGIALIGTYAALFIPAMAGERVNPMSGNGSMIWTGLFFYLWWKARGRIGWHGAFFGALVGIAVFAFAAFVGGYMRHV